MGLTKNQLEQLNNNSFPNNNSGYITPELLRTYNSSSIAATVNQDTYTTDSASFDSRIDGISVDTASLVTTSSFNSFTASYYVDSASFDSRIDGLVTSSVPAGTISSSQQITNLGFVSSSITASSLITASVSQSTITFTKGDGTTFNIVVADVSGAAGNFVTTASFNSYTASNDTKVNNLNTISQSYLAFTQSYYIDSASVDSRLDSLEAFSSSLDTTFATDAQLNASSSTLQANINTKLNTSSFNSFTQSYYVDSASVDSRLDSSLVTASVSQSTITFTKGDGSTFNITVADISGSAGDFVTTSSFNSFTQSYYVDSASVDSRLDNIEGAGYVTSTITASVLVTASFATQTLTFTKGDGSTFSVTIPDVSGSTIDTGSFATTGSNTFKGIETLQDDGGNTTAITPYSGSLLFVANTFASTSLNYITASTNKVNIILKDNNISGAFLLTGSGNIITNPNTASVGFINYIGNNNYSNNSATQFSSSMTSLPSFNSNILNAGLVYFRGGSAVTGTQIFLSNIVNNANLLFGNLAGTLTFDKAVAGYNVQSNIVNNSPIIAANVNNLASAFVFQRNFINNTPTIAMSSSAFTMNGNYLGSTGTYTNQYFSSSIGSGSATIARNIINGATNAITITGSQPAGAPNLPQVVDSMMLGTNNTVFINAAAADVVSSTANHQAISTLIAGHNIIVSGSCASGFNNFGGGFIGRYNDISGNKARNAQTVFAIGTGNSTTRKTGFLIDSGSNTYVEGSLNVSGTFTASGSNFSVDSNGNVTGSNIVTTVQGSNAGFLFRQPSSGSTDYQYNTRLERDKLNIFQYQNQNHIFGFRLTPDNLAEYTGSQFRITRDDGSGGLDDYLQLISASVTSSGGTFNGIEYTNGKAVRNLKPLLQNTTAFFYSDVIMAGVGAGTTLKVTGSVYVTGSLTTTSDIIVNNNVTVGLGSGNNNSNIVLGESALQQNTTGERNVAIGQYALQFGTSSNLNNNVAIGVEALKNTQGDQNTAIGYRALFNNTFGTYNTAIGGDTLTSITAGQNNIAIGKSAMENAENGSENIGIGVAALYRKKANSNSNTAIGPQALREHYDGGTNQGQNIAIGYDASRYNTTGSANVAIGAGALRDVVKSNENIFIGWNSGLNAQTSSVGNSLDYNTIIGARAGQNLTGTGNTGIGYYALQSHNNGTNNTVIGYNAGNGIVTGSNNTIIGANITGSNIESAILIGIGNGSIKAKYESSNWDLYANTDISGALDVSGSVTIANSNGNDLYVHGHKQFNAGEFWSTITQSGSAGVSGSITFNTSGSVYGVSIVSSSQVTMANAGVYNIQFSAQIETSAGSDTAYIWFKKNGSNIADSATKVVLANNTSQVMTVNILDTSAANDYYELGYQFTNGNATILAEAASGNIPAIPSVILTVTQAR